MLLWTWILCFSVLLFSQVNAVNDKLDKKQDKKGQKKVDKLSNQRNNTQACSHPSIRKEWRELTEVEKRSFIAANQCLKRKPSKLAKSIGSPSVWDDLVYVHLTANDEAHKGAPLLPWHRHFLFIFEGLLKSECGFNGTLPYWDFAMDSQAPERSPIFSYFGGDGRAKDHCLTTGPFANWTTKYPSVHCLSRRFNTNDPKNGHLMGAQYSPVQIEYILNTYKTYPEFRQVVEEHPHNMIHYGIGGDMFDPTTSTNDPIFWVHHANVDRIWYTWQQRYPKVAYTYGGNRKPNSTLNDAHPEDMMVYYGIGPNIKVFDTFYTLNPNYCYVYSHSIMPLTVGNKQTSGSAARSGVPNRSSTSSGANKNATQALPGSQRNQTHTFATHTSAGNHSMHKRLLDSTPGPWDRQDPSRLRLNAPLPDSYLSKRYSRQQIKEMRKREEKMAQFVQYVNELGWESNAALKYAGKDYRPAQPSEYQARHELMSLLAQAGP